MNLIPVSSSPSAVPPASDPSKTNDLSALLAAKGITLKDPTNESELQNAIQKLKLLNAAQKEKIEMHTARIKTQFTQINQAVKEIMTEKTSNTPEDEAAIAKMKQTAEQINKLFACTVCNELVTLPFVLVPCGHIACEKCIHKKDELILKELQADASPIQYLLNRKCSLCNIPTSTEYPARSIKGIIDTVAWGGFLPMQGRRDYEKPSFDKIRADALRMAATEDLAASTKAAFEQIPNIGYEEWGKGVEFQFPKECSYTFYEGFEKALTNTVKNVVVKRNESQRALQASVSAEFLLLVCPKEGFSDLNAVKKIASELLKRASKSQARMKELKSEKPSNIPSKGKVHVMEAMVAADAAMKAATEMMAALKSADQQNLTEINSAIRKAIQAQADYFKVYLQIRNSITFPIDPRNFIKEAYKIKTVSSTDSK